MKLELIDEKKLAEIRKCSVQTLRNERCGGRGIPYLKIGRSVRYDLNDVYSFLEGKKVQTADC